MPSVLPIGPYHPAIHEPEYFKVWVEGEKIVDVDINVGYNYRGVEHLMTTMEWQRCLYLAERVCGICSHAHSSCFVQNVERVGKIEVAPRGNYIRTIMAELERLHSHLLWFGILAESAGFETLFMLSWKDREIIMDILEMISGNRVHYAMNAFGGARRDITKTTGSKVMGKLHKFEKKMEKLRDISLSDEPFVTRLKGLGSINAWYAKEYGAVGPLARASGSNVDIRRDIPYFAYGDLDFDVILGKAGDSFDRLKVRIDETFESVRIIGQCLDRMPEGPIRTRKMLTKITEGESASSVEAPRGEDFHFLVAGETKPKYYHIRTPTFANFVLLPRMLGGHQIADVPLVITSVDPCFGCFDRATVIENGEERVVEFE
jgi:NADH-quinone oxidoreductase subunit D